MDSHNISIWDTIPTMQARTIRGMCRGEEGAFFRAKLNELQRVIDAMPTTGQTDGQGDNAIVYLHYFTSSCDWYITERDILADQAQAFGLADLGYGGELGYISIDEICSLTTAEIDLHWTTKKLAEVNGAAQSEADLALASVSQQQIDQEQTQTRQQAEIAARAARPLIGTAGDLTGILPGMFGLSDVPLFTEQTI